MNNENVCLNFTVNQSTSIFNIKCDIPELKGNNYKVWREIIILHLDWMDIDYVIRKMNHLVLLKLALQMFFVASLNNDWFNSNKLNSRNHGNFFFSFFFALLFISR